FRLAFRRSCACAGVAVGLPAAAGAVVLLPALLAVLARKVDALALWHHQPKPVGEGFWHRVAMTVMRRPWPIATVAVIILLALGSPFLRINLGLPDDRVLPASASSRQVQDQLRAHFSSREMTAVSLVATGFDSRSRLTDIDAYA